MAGLVFKATQGVPNNHNLMKPHNQADCRLPAKLRHQVLLLYTSKCWLVAMHGQQNVFQAKSGGDSTTSRWVPARTEGGPPRHQTPHSAHQSPALHPPACGQVSSTAFAPARQTGTTHPCGCLHGNTEKGGGTEGGRRGRSCKEEKLGTGGWEGCKSSAAWGGV